MTRIGKLWTAGIAYVALTIGAGLSILYNIVDTLERRGADMDMTDWVTAVGAPAMVVIMVELFVSRWWIGQPRSMQALRWLGCLVIGGVAMRTSWTHGHDLMSTRGQAADVAIMWPLAIDLLAVMATALILAGRRVRGQVVETDTRTRGHADIADVDTGATETDTRTQGQTDIVSPADAWTSGYEDALSADTEPMTMRPLSELDAWTSGYEDALSTLGQEMAAEVVDYVHGHASTAVDSPVDMPLPRRTRTMDGPSYPADMADMVEAWRTSPEAPDRADMVKLLAGHYGVSTRSVRRWLSALG